MHILMTGATGLIGRALGEALAARGDTLVCLVRDIDRARRVLPFPARCLRWDHREAVPAEALRGVHAVIHLAGEPAGNARWTAAKKALVRDSRVLGTQRLVQAVQQHGDALRVFVMGSALGYYGDAGDRWLDAASPPGAGFLADLTRDWEAACAPLAQRADLRVPVLRTGVVLARQGGALAEMLPMFRLSLAGRLGDGRQWLSWIHHEDIVRLFIHALDRAGTGVLEGVAPQPVDNRGFTQALCAALGVRQNLALPAPAVRALFGERADMVLASTRLAPRATQAGGFQFRFETVAAALDDLLAPWRDGLEWHEWRQWLPAAPAALWPEAVEPGRWAGQWPADWAWAAAPDTPLQHGAVLGLRGAGPGWRWQGRLAVQHLVPAQALTLALQGGPLAPVEHRLSLTPLAGGSLWCDRLQHHLPAGWGGRLALRPWVAQVLARGFAHRAGVLWARAQALAGPTGG